MKILINTASNYKGGGVQVARSFIEECKSYPEHQFEVILGQRLAELIDKGSFPEHFNFHKMDYRPATRVLRFQSASTDLKHLEEQASPDVVFTTSGPAYWRPKAPHLVGYNLPHYIYRDSPFFDQIPLTKRIKWDVKGRFIKYFFKRDADAYVVQTDDVNRRLRKWLDTQKVFTVSNTVSHYYLNPKTVPPKLPEKKEGEFRFLTLSAWYKHKNLEIIPKVIELWPQGVKERIRFVLTLPDRDLERTIPRKYHSSIYNIGPVPPEEGPALYEECDALFLPTLLECFSASYAEAMQMGRPILTSDLGFAHSVCGKAALYADPLNPHQLAEKIIELLNNQKLREILIKKGRAKLHTFATAKERAAEYLRICRELADAR